MKEQGNTEECLRRAKRHYDRLYGYLKGTKAEDEIIRDLSDLYENYVYQLGRTIAGEVPKK